MGFFGGGYKNPADAAQPYLNRIPGAIGQYYNPYFQAGTGALPQLQGQYGQLLNDPGGKLNQIGQGFHESPGFQFALQQALQGAGHAAAAGGQAGSPEHQQRNIELATQLGNQDYQNYLHNALGLYGQGLEGERGLSQQGQLAGQSYADQIAQTLGQQAQLGYYGQQNANKERSSLFGGIVDAIGALGAFTPFGGAGSAFETAYNRFRGH